MGSKSINKELAKQFPGKTAKQIGERRRIEREKARRMESVAEIQHQSHPEDQVEPVSVEPEAEGQMDSSESDSPEKETVYL